MLTATLTREEELHWIALKVVPGLGTRKAALLIEQFRTPQAIFRASPSELEMAGVSGSVAQSIASGCAFDEAVEQQQRMLDCGAQVVPISDPLYPQKLREIFDPPVALFARGRLELLDTVTLAVVGTRRPTPYGIAVAERLSADLARAGLTIVSGMARGIDTSSHKAALANNGNTIAVFGCGVDVLYPADNRKLMNEIASRGLLISEFPMGAPAYPQNFPIRNRIVSGLSSGVLVIEGAQYSGSSITARLALDQGREVFAVPGSIMSKMSWGPNLLIKQGAKLVQEWNDIVVELPPDDRRRLADDCRARLGAEEQTDLPLEPPGPNAEINRSLLKLLKPDSPTHLDELIDGLETHSSSEIIAALFELELSGMVKQMPGKNFMKVW
jgi:DNA processing protein